VIAREQPGARELLGDPVVAPGRKPFDEAGDGLVDGDEVPVENEHGGGVGPTVQVAGGESGDTCQWLGIEHNKRAGGPVGRGDGVVGDEAPGDGPAFLVIDVRQSTLGGAAGMRRWRRR
jgi:hypothetical protein